MAKAIAHLCVALVAAAVPIVWISITNAGEAAAREKPSPAKGERERVMGAGIGNGPSAAHPAAQRSAGGGVPFAGVAIDRVLADPDDYEAQLDLRRLIFALRTPAECLEVSGKFMAQGVEQRELLRGAFRDLYARWAELDPRGAANYALHFNTAGYGSAAMEGGFVTWAARDLDAALEWLRGIGRPPALDRSAIVRAAMREIVDYKKDAPELWQRVGRFADPELRREMQHAVLEQWARTGAPADLVRWAAEFPDAEQREPLVAKAIRAIGIEEPRSAFYFLNKIEDPERRAEIAHEVFWPYALARTPDIWTSPPDPVQALQNHTADWPLVVFRDAGDAMTRHSARSALEKANTIPAGPARDEFILGMMHGVAFSDQPDAVLPALELLSDASLRERAKSLFETRRSGGKP